MGRLSAEIRHSHDGGPAAWDTARQALKEQAGGDVRSTPDMFSRVPGPGSPPCPHISGPPRC